MSSTTHIGILAGLGLSFSVGLARADEMQIRGRIAHLRVQPSSDARIKVKLGGGRSVAVLGQSEDGQWIHVKVEVEKGPDTIPFDGWLALAEVRGERMLSTEGGAAAPASSQDAPTANSAADWDPAPSSDKSAPPAASSDAAWFDDSKTPAGGTVSGGGSKSGSASSSDDPWGGPASSSSSSDEKQSGAADGW